MQMMKITLKTLKENQTGLKNTHLRTSNLYSAKNISGQFCMSENGSQKQSTTGPGLSVCTNAVQVCIAGP